MKKIILLAIICFSIKIKAQTQNYLDINNVKALILNKGDMFWNATGNGAPQYEVPKGSNKHCNFATSVWMGGFDAGNQLHMAGMTYRQTGTDYFSGPLDTLTGSTTASVSNSFNKVWRVSTADINLFINAWNTGSIAAQTYTPSNDFVTWPANGNTAAGYSKGLAPFYDHNGDGIYNYQQGDYPKIKGDQMIWYVINDKLNAHTETGGLPLGVEIQVSAYAYNCPNALALYPELNYTTFYEYKIINRSAIQYNNAMIAIWCDGDIGSYTNDYIGCVQHANIGYMYNATPSDGTYGNYPPILSYKILHGPHADPLDGLDNDNDGFTDEAGEECQFNSFMYYNNSVGPFPAATTNPGTAINYFNYMRSIWKDGAPLKADSTGYLSPSTTVATTQYAYPGDIQTSSGWTESLQNNAPGDRRFIIGNGPFTLKPAAVNILEFAVLTTFDSTANGYKNLNKVLNQNSSVLNFYDLSNKPSCQSVITTIKKITREKLDLRIIPNPASRLIKINSTEQLLGAEVKVFNSLGELVLASTIQTTHYTLDVSEIPNGVYFVEVKTKTTSGITKLVKN
jgi:hypothetical protein